MLEVGIDCWTELETVEDRFLLVQEQDFVVEYLQAQLKIRKLSTIVPNGFK